jgi:hypothetical protein
MADCFHKEAQQTAGVPPDPDPEHHANKDTCELEDAPAKKPMLIQCVWEQMGQWNPTTEDGDFIKSELARNLKNIEVASKGDGDVNMPVRDVK